MYASTAPAGWNLERDDFKLLIPPLVPTEYPSFLPSFQPPIRIRDVQANEMGADSPSDDPFYSIPYTLHPNPDSYNTVICIPLRQKTELNEFCMYGIRDT